MVSQLCIPTQERGNDRTFDVIRHSARSEKNLRHSSQSEKSPASFCTERSAVAESHE